MGHIMDWTFIFNTIQWSYPKLLCDFSQEWRYVATQYHPTPVYKLMHMYDHRLQKENEKEVVLW
jgi:hypothetical protein